MIRARIFRREQHEHQIDGFTVQGDAPAWAVDQQSPGGPFEHVGLRLVLGAGAAPVGRGDWRDATHLQGAHRSAVERGVQP